MTSSAEQMRRYKGHPLFSFGFRPFFLAGAIIAAIVPIITALGMSGAVDFGFAGGVLNWHAHEMVYGFLSAIIAGFILTAVPNWTGRLPLMGTGLAGLFFLWLAGRAALLLSGNLNGLVIGLIDSSFLLLLDVFLWREVLRGKNWRNAPVCVLVFFFAIGNVIWHFEIARGSSGTTAIHFGIAMVAILLSLIGGRVTPSFTRNWLAKSGLEPINAPFSVLDKIAIAVLVTGLLLWVFAPYPIAAGAVLLLAGGLHILRLARWQGWRTFAEPLITILHVGYCWLAVSIILLAASLLWPTAIPSVVALHALTAGAMGVMTLAVMTRATLGHTGRVLSADTVTLVIYALVNLGAITRVAAAYLPMPYTSALMLSGLLWGGAFGLFAIVYGRLLLLPRPERP